MLLPLEKGQAEVIHLIAGATCFAQVVVSALLPPQWCLDGVAVHALGAFWQVLQ